MENKKFNYLWQYVEHWASVDPGFTALRSGDKSYTYGEFEEMTENMATAFLGAGIDRGDMIATLLPASPEYIMALVAADKVGARVTALDVKYKAAELKRFISHIRPKAVLSLTGTEDFNLESALVSVALELELADGISFYMVGNNSVGHPFESLYLPAPEYRTRLIDCKVSQTPDDGLLVIFTGGTTGVPKSAMLSKENVTAMAEAEARMLINALEILGIKGRTKTLACLPPSHVGGSVEMICSAIVAGSEIIIHDTWSPQRVLETIEAEDIPWIGGVPTMYAIILLLPELDRYDLSSLKLSILSGEKVKLDLLEQIRSRISPNIIIGYGSTEAGSEVTFTKIGDPFEKIAEGYVGKPLEGVEIQIAGPDGSLLAAGEEGEIQVRGKLTIGSYFRMPEEDTAGFTDEGFCKTGDLGVLTQEGDLYIRGRLKHIIRVGSYTVMPSEVEEVAVQHPAVGMAAAIGVPDEIYGEKVWLVVSPAPGQTVNPQDVIAHCETQLAKFKVPRKIIVEADLPITRVGKVHRVEIQNSIIKSLKGNA